MIDASVSSKPTYDQTQVVDLDMIDANVDKIVDLDMIDANVDKIVDLDKIDARVEQTMQRKPQTKPKPESQPESKRQPKPMPHKPKPEPKMPKPMPKPKSEPKMPKPMPKPKPEPKPEPQYIPLTAAEKRRAEEIKKLKEKQENFKLESIEDSLGDAIDSKFGRPEKKEKAEKKDIVIPDAFDIHALAMGKRSLPREEE